jgi:hypothetical protein
MMAYVKLDCGILDSTLWIERECRELFITALLMARPKEYTQPVPQIAVNSLDLTGWVAPPDWYGFVEAAGPGIIRRAGIDQAIGLAALEKLGNPDRESRTPDHEGRRMIRIDGGYLILNFDKYREKDHTRADRQRRFRDKQRAERNAVTERLNGEKHPEVTEAVSSKQKHIKTNTRVKTEIPKDFAVSESVAEWAKAKGFDKLDQHLESFIAKCNANGYKYADWDAAFREAVRGDWAGIRKNAPPKQNLSPGIRI